MYHWIRDEEELTEVNIKGKLEKVNAVIRENRLFDANE